jgi:hypothetical protein
MQPSTPSKPNENQSTREESYHYIGSKETSLLRKQSDVGEIKSLES